MRQDFSNHCQSTRNQNEEEFSEGRYTVVSLIRITEKLLGKRLLGCYQLHSTPREPH